MLTIVIPDIYIDWRNSNYHDIKNLIELYEKYFYIVIDRNI